MSALDELQGWLTMHVGSKEADEAMSLVWRIMNEAKHVGRDGALRDATDYVDGNWGPAHFMANHLIDVADGRAPM